MNKNLHTYDLLTSHLTFVHIQWEKWLQAGDLVIDATCGNGKDTLVLANMLANKGSQWTLLGIDIQKTAIDHTLQRLIAHLSPNDLKHITLFHQSHATFPKEIYSKPIRLIVYNLGYLPQGDHALTTLTSSTLISLKNGISLVENQQNTASLICITCYPGHSEGALEQQALLQFVDTLDPIKWTIEHHRKINSSQAPSVLLLYTQTP